MLDDLFSPKLDQNEGDAPGSPTPQGGAAGMLGASPIEEGMVVGRNGEDGDEAVGERDNRGLGVVGVVGDDGDGDDGDGQDDIEIEGLESTPVVRVVQPE